MSSKQQTSLYWLNVIEILGIIILLLLTFTLQFLLKELPCPLCLLQRIGFIITSLGLLFNLRYGIKPSHYVITLLGALYTSFVALRQIALHVVPGSGEYGDSVFGLHLYTWSFLISMMILVYTSVILGFQSQYKEEPSKTRTTMFYVLFVLLLFITLANFVAVVFECGIFGTCPDNPMVYKL